MTTYRFAPPATAPIDKVHAAFVAAVNAVLGSNLDGDALAKIPLELRSGMFEMVELISEDQGDAVRVDQVPPPDYQALLAHAQREGKDLERKLEAAEKLNNQLICDIRATYDAIPGKKSSVISVTDSLKKVRAALEPLKATARPDLPVGPGGFVGEESPDVETAKPPKLDYELSAKDDGLWLHMEVDGHHVTTRLNTEGATMIGGFNREVWQALRNGRKPEHVERAVYDRAIEGYSRCANLLAQAVCENDGEGSVEAVSEERYAAVPGMVHLLRKQERELHELLTLHGVPEVPREVQDMAGMESPLFPRVLYIARKRDEFAAANGKNFATLQAIVGALYDTVPDAVKSPEMINLELLPASIKKLRAALGNPFGNMPNEVVFLFSAIWAEVQRARQKFPNPLLTLTALGEEHGELVQAVMNHYHQKRKEEAGTVTVLDSPAMLKCVRKELIQTGAMLVRLMEEGDPLHNLPPIHSPGSEAR